jgi:calcineurin-like phosphoesterase family protein
MAIFFTSDTHYNHQNILKYCPNRKFNNIDDHNECLIKAWNDVVSENDVVFHLGDFAFGRIEDSLSILDKLKGKKVLIAGNHDVRHLNYSLFRDHFNSIKFGYHEVEVSFQGRNTLVVLCHYPLESFNKMRYGSFHLHGHCHTPPGELKVRAMDHRKDVGVDSRDDHAPWSKDVLLTSMIAP